ncbi:MAG: DUF2716 domain-containing protein, partial [Ilumatobacteraceae bacterium]|nr:DUF2716 domain-containing protein [Ilumatobacteraceae bacterium]
MRVDGAVVVMESANKVESAWEEIDDYESVWTPFDQAFRFQAGPGVRSGIKEPAGSVTYGLKEAWSGKSSDWVMHAVNALVVWGLARSVDGDDPLIVLDWQHP